ncbi:MAG: hypothetical protein Q8R02_06050 [Hyphomonadaceae bacterium]|nr:hypothetical protein [Hyphomonadaceae bacterium]
MQFSISDDVMVVTSSYVTVDGSAILEVSHDDDGGGGSLWQFHCGNGDYSMDKMQLVRLDTILAIDPTVASAAHLRPGQTAKRAKTNSIWIVTE